MSALFVVVPVVVVVIFVLILVVGVVGVGRNLADRRWFAENGVRVQGELVAVRVKTQTNMTTGANGASNFTTTRRYTPTVRFTTTDGQAIEAQTPTTGRRPGREGDLVSITYDPSDPSRARIM